MIKEQMILNSLYEAVIENLHEGTPLFHGKSEKVHFEILLPATDKNETDSLSLKVLNSVQKHSNLKGCTFLLKSDVVYDPETLKEKVR